MTDDIKENNNNLESTTGNFTELSNKIKDQTNVKLDKNYTRVDNETSVYIMRDITINADGHTIDGSNLGTIFNVQNGFTLTLQNANLINSEEIIYNEGKLTLTNTNASEGSHITNNGTILGTVTVKVLDNETHADAQYRSDYLFYANVYYNNIPVYYGSLYFMGINNYVYVYNPEYSYQHVKSEFNPSTGKFEVTKFFKYETEKLISACYLNATNNNTLTGVVNINTSNLGNFTELQDLISKAGDTLTLNKSYKRLDSEDLIINIDKTIVIDGAGLSIDNYNNITLFNVSSNGNLTLKNTNLLGPNKNSYTGIVLISNYGELSLENIYVMGVNRAVSPTDSMYLGNSSFDGYICIYDNGKINNNLIITVLENRTNCYSINQKINITAEIKVSDIEEGTSCSLKIKGGNFTFYINDTEEIPASYNSGLKSFVSNSEYTVKEGVYPVTAKYSNAPNDIKPAIIDTYSGNFTELQNLISTNMNGTLTLDKNYVRESKKYLTIKKNITIDCAGHTINANSFFENLQNIFVIEDNVNFTLKNAVIINTYGGSAIHAVDVISNITLINCTFTSCDSSVAGLFNTKAKENADKYPTLTVVNCTFSNFTHSGSNVIVATESSFINCTFTGITVTKGSILAPNKNGHMNVTNCTFDSNSPHALISLFLNASVNVANCTFKNNHILIVPITVDSSESAGTGKMINVTDSIFENNTNTECPNVIIRNNVMNKNYDAQLYIHNLTVNSGAYIINEGTIVSPVTIYVWDNDTHDVQYGEKYLLYGNVSCENIPIYYGDFEFDGVDNVTLSANFNETTNRFEFLETIKFAGTKILNASYGASDNNTIYTSTIHSMANVTSFNITVNPIGKDNITYGDNMTVNVTVIGVKDYFDVLDNNVTGNVTVVINGKEYKFNVTEGVGNITITDLIGAGNNITVNGTFVSDNYNDANSNTTFTINKYDPVLSNINVTVVNYVPVVDFNLTGARGEDLSSYAVITFVKDEDSTVYPAGSSLRKGNYTAFVNFTGNENYTAVCGNASFYVPAIDVPYFVVDVVCDVYGNVTFTVTAKGIDDDNLTGPISIVVDDELSSAILYNGSYTGVLTGLSVGKHILNVIFTPRTPNYYNAVSNYTVFAVGSSIPTVNITVKDSFDYGEYVDISTVVYGTNGTVIGNATTVTVYDENNNTVDWTGILDAGLYTVVAFYKGDGNYTDANATEGFIVNAVEVPDFVIDISSITYGDNIVVKVSDVVGVLDEALNGTIFVNISGKTYEFNVTDGVGNITITDLFAAGDYDVEVTFAPDSGNYLAYENTTSLTIAKYESVVDLDVNSVIYGNAVNVDCEVTGFDGVVLSNDYYVVDAYNNPVTLSRSLAVGTYTVIVNYTGNENHTSAYANKSFVVSPANVTGFIVNVDNIVYGNNVTITVNALGVNDELLNGTAIVTISGVKYEVAVNNGEGSRSISKLFPVGSYDVFAVLNTGNYNVANDSDVFTVYKADVVSFNVSVDDITYGEYAVINIKDAIGVRGELLDCIAIVTIDGVNYTVIVSNGAGNLTIDKLLDAGSYDADAVLVVDNYEVASDSDSFNVAKLDTVVTAGNLTVTAFIGGKLVATLTDANGEVLAGRNITFVFNGKEYVRTTDANGEATLTISRNIAGTYPVTVTFAGEKNYNGAAAEVTVKIAAAYVTVKQVITASNYVKKYVAKYSKVPTTVTVGSIKCTYAQYSYLASAAIKNINAKKSVATKIKVVTVKATNKVTKVTVKATKKQYLTIVNSLYTKGAKGTLPSYITVNGKKVGFNDYTVGLARILAFYSSNSRLPNYVTFTYKY